MATLQLEAGNVWTTIAGDNSKINALIDRLENPLYGGLGLYNVDGRIFTGIAQLLAKQLNTPLVFENKEPVTPKDIPIFVDRCYQREAVAAAIKHKRGVIKIPTGGGKTLCAAGILASLPCRWLYLVHKANLVESSADTFEHLLKEKVGRIHGFANDPSHRIVCATFKSLFSRSEHLPLIQSVEGIIVDEAHTLPAKEAFAVVLNTTNAYYRIGLGATPFFREDSHDIHTIALLGPEIYSVDPQSLAKSGYLVLPSVEWLTCAQSVEAKYPEAYDALITNSVARNALIVETIKRAPKPAIVFVKLLEHQKIVFDLLQKTGLRSLAFVRGDTPLDERQQLVSAIKSNTLDVVVSSSVFSEGMDAPNLRTVMNATASSSWISSIQEPGRGTRPSNGKTTFKMYDFNDVGNKWFEKHTAERYTAYRVAGFDVVSPSTLATRTLDTISERCSMLEAEAPAPATGSNWRTWLYFLIAFGACVALQNWLQLGSLKL